MARARLLKPGFFSNDKLAEMHPHARLLFAGLWTLADREGRLPDRPLWIKGSIFPYENVPVAKYLQGLDERDFILRYETAEGRFIQIQQFLKHQSPHIKEPASTIPAPDEHQTSTVLAPPFSGTSPSVAVSDPVPVAVTEAVAVTPQSEADTPPAHPFSVLYSQNHRERTGKELTPAVHGRALSLEQKYGAEECIQVAEEKGWEHDPGYYVGRLEDRKNGKQLQTTGRVSGRGSRNTAPADLVDEWERYAAGEA